MKLNRAMAYALYVSSLALSGCNLNQETLVGTIGSQGPIDRSPTKLIGGEADTYLGASLVIMSDDFNGDGKNDIVVSGSRENGNDGAVYVYSGADQSLLYRIQGTDIVDTSFGNTVMVVDDRDADGVSDLLVTSGLFGNYHLVLFSGADGTLLWRHTEASMWFGNTSFEIEDTNSDGVKDILSSTVGYSYPVGRVWAISGADGTTLWTVTGSGAGAFMFIRGLVPDANADSITDIVVADTLTTDVTLVSGADGTPIATCAGVASSIQPFVDVNLDGKVEFAINNPNWSASTGYLMVYDIHTCTALYTVNGQNVGDLFAAQANIVADLDSDGIKDILVNANNYNITGRIYAISGADGSTIYTVDARAVYSVFGNTLADYNGDGAVDWVTTFGNPLHVEVRSGATGTILFEMISETAGATFGSNMELHHDFDDDGTPDIALSDAAYDSNRGKVYIFSGVDGTLLFSWTGENVGDALALPYTGFAGQINSDSALDFVCVAPSYDTNRGAIYVFSKGF